MKTIALTLVLSLGFLSPALAETSPTVEAQADKGTVTAPLASRNQGKTDSPAVRDAGRKWRGSKPRQIHRYRRCGRRCWNVPHSRPHTGRFR